MPTPLCVCVVVLKDGKVLATTRRHDHTKFGLPGGKVDPEDGDPAFDLERTLRTAACRELQEETGITSAPADLIQVYAGVCADETGVNPDSLTITYLTPTFEGSPTRQPGEPPVAWVEWDTLCAEGAFSAYNQKVRNALESKP